MATKKTIENDKLIRCVDCKNYPNMCGYYSTNKNDFRKKHTCPYVSEHQQGFKPAEEMSLKDTIHQYKCWLHGTAKNTELLDMALYYMKRGEQATIENIELKKYKAMWEEQIKGFNDIITDPNEPDGVIWTEINVVEILKWMNETKDKYFPKDKPKKVKD